MIRPFLLLALVFVTRAFGQLPAGTSDASAAPTKPTASADDTSRIQASDALEQGQYALAERLLLPLAEQHPADAHVLFDLAAAQDALDQTSQAESTYRKAIAADKTFFEPRLALGLMLARGGRDADAETVLREALRMPAPDSPPDPALVARAYRALAHLDEHSDPASARDEMLAALKLTPATPDDDRLSASLAEQSLNAVEAVAAYRRLLATSPDDQAAAAALGRLLVNQGKLDQAELVLGRAHAAHPDDPAVCTSLVLLRARQGKSAEAAELAATLYRKQPTDEVARLYGGLLLDARDYQQAAQVLEVAAQHSPANGPLLDQRADALIHLRRFTEAEHLLVQAVEHPASFPTQAQLGEAAGHLAFAAFSDNNPQETLRALALRATFLPQSPSTLYLGAAAHDMLHHTRESRELYRQFLAAANGKFPDEETEAHRRLLALEQTK